MIYSQRPRTGSPSGARAYDAARGLLWRKRPSSAPRSGAVESGAEHAVPLQT